LSRKNKHPGWVCEPHTRWVADRQCSVMGCCNDHTVVPHHLRDDPDVPFHERGGTGMKPMDKWTIPLCMEHHSEIHQGREKFERRHGIDCSRICEFLARNSPYRHFWENEG